MKNLHFCTPKLLEFIKKPKNKFFYTYRTGFVPEIFKGDIVNINERINENDTFLFKGRILAVSAMLLMQCMDEYRFKGMFPEEEIKKYNKKFHKDHWFFQIKIEKFKPETIDDFEKL